MQNKNKNKIKIMDMPQGERPRERLAKYGAEALSNAELLAIILRTGSQGETAVDVGNKLLKRYGGNLRELFTTDVNELSKMKGLGFVKAVQLKACLELAKRIFEYKPEKNQVRSTQDVVNMLMPELQFEKQEKLFAVFLDTKNYLIKRKLVSVGGIDVNVFKPKEILYMAVRENSSAMIIVHNHPSGDPEPSEDDIKITKKLVEAGGVIGIPLQDHIVIGDGTYISMKERGII